MGLGRENITGVIPLYLFKEHWEVARRKAPPIYGFLCTLDIMGYTSSQYFTVPYLVLAKAMEKSQDERKEVFIQIEKMILKSCMIMLQGNEEHRKNVIKSIVDFHTSPEFRTIDVVPSIPLLLTQLYVLTQIENYQEFFGD